MNSSRRTFLRHSTCAALSTASASAALFDLMKTAAVAAPAAQAGDYKALVCVFLYGGNDGHNMLVPRTAADYSLYSRTRGALSVPLAQLRALNFKDSTQREFGLHPSLAELQTLFNTNQKLAVIANVGPLLHPVTRTEYRAKSKPLPPQLFSHSDQQVHWQTSWPDQVTRTGWGGRVADALNALNTNNQVSMNLSFAGSNTFQVGTQVTPYEMSSDGPLKLSGFDTNPQTTNVISQSIRSGMYTAQPYTNLLDESWNSAFRRSLDAGAAFRAALDAAPAFTTVFPTNNNLAKQLNMVAKVIAARNVLNVRRQIFFVTLDGFDTHGDQLAGHPGLLQRLSQALNAFYAATVEMGVQNQVTAFTASDFGRALKPNAGGTDHGWGSHHFVLGGAVSGGKIYGTFPDLTVDSVNDAGNGRLIPTTAVDQYAATLASWFGVSATDMPLVVPNLGNFATNNLGFVV